MSHVIPNTNPDLVGVFDDGDSFVPIIAWEIEPDTHSVIGVGVAGERVRIVLDQATGLVFSQTCIWRNLFHYREAPND